MKITDQLLMDLPKTDLHLHLDGSLRISSLIEMARERNVDLPSYTEDGLNELVFKASYDSLVEYLQGFNYTLTNNDDGEQVESHTRNMHWLPEKCEACRGAAA